MAIPFPFAAIVGQDEMKLAIQIVAVDPKVGGVLALGDRGTGKSTAVRALADLLPPIQVVKGCAYGCDPRSKSLSCPECSTRKAGSKVATETKPVPVIDLPLGATEDRVVGCARPGASLESRRQSFFARLAGTGQPGVFVHRRGEFAGRPFG
jgi:magnesium chelatase subunit I